MIVILIWSLNLIFNKMAFLVLLCVYTGFFLIRGFFSCLTPAPVYTWALIGHRTCQGWMRAEILCYWWEEKRLGKRWILLWTWVRPLGREDPLEKGMATHSSILAWRIPWAEEPGKLQLIKSQSQTRLSDWHRDGWVKNLGVRSFPYQPVVWRKECSPHSWVKPLIPTGGPVRVERQQLWWFHASHLQAHI